MNEIIKEPNELLHQKSEPVSRPFQPEDLQLLDEMFNYVKDHEETAVGLSAVQVGVLKRMCAIRVKLGNKTVAYVWKQDKLKDSYRLNGYVGIELFISSNSIKKTIEMNHECKYLLKKAGYTLASSSTYALVIRYCIENKIYDLDKVNEYLTQYGYEDSLIY